MKSGSTSIDRQSDTQAPHWMQAIVCVTSTIDSRGDEVLALGDRLLVDQPRRDALDLLPVDRVHVDDQVLDHGHVAHRLDLDDAVAREPSASSRWVWQARPGWPLTRTPHEPQIAARHEQRTPIEPSKRALACRIPSSTERCGSSSMVCSSQYGASPDSGS